MPEGPEVATIARILHEKLAGKMLMSFHITDKSRYYSKEPLENSDKLKKGLKLRKVWFRGKKLILTFNRLHLVSSLGMEGHWQFVKGPHSGLIFTFGTHYKECSPPVTIKEFDLYYDDSRHFGRTTVCLTNEALTERLSDIGPDLLQDEITLEQYMSVLKRKTVGKMEIGNFLLEQKYFSSIGNIYRAEILYESKISPFRLISSLSDDEIKLLLNQSLSIIKEAYISGGTTSNTYLDPDGSKGKFIPKIYSCKVDPFGNPVVKDKGKADRIIHWVPAVQK